ncbi:MAG: DUF86 domain-containing protein [Chloroflexota bacterium]
MLRDPLAFLWNVKDCALAIREFTAQKTSEDCLADRLLRAAVERQFGIIGEALNQLSRIAPEVVQQIPRHTEAIALRNVLIHGYGQIRHAEVWRIIHEDLSPLLDVIDSLPTMLESESP